MHLVEIAIFSIYHFIIRPTTAVNRAKKNCTNFYKIRYIFRKSWVSKNFMNKSWSHSLISLKKTKNQKDFADYQN